MGRVMSETKEPIENGAPRGFRKWSVVAVLGAAMFIIVIDTTIMNVSISAIVADLNTTVTGIQAVITMYALVTASLVITGGKLGDIWGRRRAFVIGLCLFAAGASITGFAANIYMLFLSLSVMEALGAALMLPSIWALITTNYKGKDRVHAMALLAGILAAAATLGPIIGGWITQAMGWRWAFRIEVVIAIVVIAFTRLIRDEPVKEKPRLDYMGIVISVLGMGLFVFGILKMSTWGLINPSADAPFSLMGISPSFWFIVFGLVLIGMFVLWQRRLERGPGQPLIRMSLFKNWSFSSGLIMVALLYMILAGLLFCVPLFMQKVMGLNALETGIGMLPLTALMLIASAVTPKLTRLLYPKYVVMAGMVFTIAGCMLLFFFVPEANPTRVDMILGLSVLGAGLGLASALIPNIVMSSVAPDAVGEASAINETFLELGFAVGTALLGAILIAALSFGILGLTRESKILTEDKKRDVHAAVQKDVSVMSDSALTEDLKGQPEEIKQEVVRINDRANKRAFGITTIAAAIIGLLALIVSLFMPRKKLE